MKRLISCILFSALFSSSPLFAFEYCQQREIFEAKMAHAKKFGISFSKVDLEEHKPGPWTRMDGNNHGNDLVGVFHWSEDGEQKIKSRYLISAKQIGKTSDCKVMSLKLQ